MLMLPYVTTFARLVTGFLEFFPIKFFVGIADTVTLFWHKHLNTNITIKDHNSADLNN